MEIGVDSFAAMFSGNSSRAINDADALAQLLERIEHADRSGLDVFGKGALLVGSAEEVAEKILRHSKALGGIVRLTFQMDTAELPHEKLMESIELIGTRIKPLLNL